MAKHNYKCPRCKTYDDLNGYFCRICGSSVQFDHKSRGRINHTYQTDERYCDHCGGEKDSGSCRPKIDRLF